MSFLVIWLVMGFVCGAIAENKHRSIAGWMILGFLFGIFALAIILMLPEVKTQSQNYLNQ